MPDVAAFQGFRYAPGVEPAAVTSPPYDVISPRERAALEAASPHNVVRLILGPLGVSDDRKYIEARRLLDAWIDEGVLVRDDAPSLYLYEERFEVDGERRSQVGLLAAVEISDEVMPHERVMGPVVDDRLAVIRTTEANLSPVFCLYWSRDDAARRVIEATMAEEPYAAFTDEGGVDHRAWRISDQERIKAVAAALAGAKTVIADGHHRYRTAEAYKEERRADDGPGPWDRMLLYLVDAERDGPALLPIHRVVHDLAVEDALDKLSEHFEVEEVPAADPDELALLVNRRRAEGRSYALLGPKSSWIVTLRDEKVAAQATEGDHSDAWRDLDVAVLHSLVFEQILGGAAATYVHHPAEAEEAVQTGEATFAVLLARTPTAAVREIAEAKDSMPPKSTFFIPKPRTGIVIRSLRV
ncbi:MAG TPA: DUF1015 domain-containing protein [Actinomycetota bacterium]|nr:DUF1015 domain-containing protein [Actinomycetota bacterium]